MKTSKRKIALVGCGKVGMAFAYSVLQNGICDELVLIDTDVRRAAAEAEDLRHGLCFLSRVTNVYAGDYADLSDTDILLITAGVAQSPGEDRMALARRNTAVMEDVVDKIKQSAFRGIYLIATNPVDIMAQLVKDLSGAPAHRVIGSGTILDTARFRAMLGAFFQIDPKNLHAYVLGEHGETEFVPWSQVSVASKWAPEICRQHPLRFPISELLSYEAKTRRAAGELIEAKGATSYGIATALCRLCDAILSDDNSIFTLSCYLQGEYGCHNVYIGVPAVVGKNGVREIVTLDLTKEESERFRRCSCYLKSVYQDLKPSLV